MDAFSQMKVYNSYADFFNANPDRLYRFRIYRRMFTPHEQEHKFMDESFYEDYHASKGLIREVIPLPDGDLLLGIATIYESLDELKSENRSMDYLRLSEIRLDYMPIDAERCAEEDELYDEENAD